MLYGSGKHTYRLADWHAEYPGGWQPTEVNSILIDAQDRLYAFNTGQYQATVFDRDGTLLSTWGEDRFTHNHGAWLAPDGSMWVADDGNHTVTRFSPDGQPLLALGDRDRPADTGYTTVGPDGKPFADFLESIATTKRSGPPFNAPTDVAVSPRGEIYVADGYGNARVHKFSAEGTLLRSWGEPGKGPGQFVVPHGIAVDQEGRVLVVDRHNDRIQIFDQDGRYLTEWGDLMWPTGIFIDADQTVYVSELTRPGISVFDIDGRLLARWGNERRTEEDPLFVTLHDITVDSEGSIYVCEVMGVIADTPFFPTRKTRMIQKFVRVT
jgi:DNA-binding beta-propeller fold protein YncE